MKRLDTDGESRLNETEIATFPTGNSSGVEIKTRITDTDKNRGARLDGAKLIEAFEAMSRF